MNIHVNAPTPARRPHLEDTGKHTCRRIRARRRFESLIITAQAKPLNSSAAALVADKRFKCTECGKCCSGAGEVWQSGWLAHAEVQSRTRQGLHLP
ncbi:hypothetical protein WJX82_005435 [Trebouxia sp. C0006]